MSTSRDRMRLHRALRRVGHIMVTIRLTDRKILGLAERGYGGGEGITLADAVEAFLCDALSRRFRHRKRWQVGRAEIQVAFPAAH